MRLDDYSLATRISFLLWDAPPDAELAGRGGRAGALRTQAGLEQQVDRLIASPRFERRRARLLLRHVRVTSSSTACRRTSRSTPNTPRNWPRIAQEQALRTIVDLLVTQQGDYRDLFTTRKTFMNRNLGSLYKVPVADRPGSTAGRPIRSARRRPARAASSRSAGFLMLDPTHEGRSSPTIRGKSVRELFLCQPVPLPPANVDFSAVQDTTTRCTRRRATG